MIDDNAAEIKKVSSNNSSSTTLKKTTKPKWESRLNKEKLLNNDLRNISDLVSSKNNDQNETVENMSETKLIEGFCFQIVNLKIS